MIAANIIFIFVITIAPVIARLPSIALSNSGQKNQLEHLVQENTSSNSLHTYQRTEWPTLDIVSPTLTNVDNSTNLGGLIGSWSLGEGTGNIAYDRSGSTNNGTLVNSPTWESGINCEFEGCLYFQASNCQFIAGTSAAYTLADTTFTVTGWFKTLGSLATQQVIIGDGGVNAGPGWNIRLNSSGQLVLILNGESRTILSKQTTAKFNDHNWHYFAVVVTTSTSVASYNTASIYVDGSTVASSGGSPIGEYVPSDSVWSIGVGISNGTPYDCFNGGLENLEIYNRALSPDETAVAQTFSFLTVDLWLIGTPAILISTFVGVQLHNRISVRRDKARSDGTAS